MDSSKLMPTAAEIADLTSGISELQVPDDFDELEKLVLAKQKEVEDQRGIVNSINALLKHLEKLNPSSSPSTSAHGEVTKDAYMNRLQKENAILQRLEKEFVEMKMELMTRRSH